MTNSITFDINEHLKSTYPKLTPDQADLIATDVKNRWDYRHLIEDVDIKCKQTAYYANIKLGEKNDIEEIPLYEPLEHTSEGCWIRLGVVESVPIV